MSFCCHSTTVEYTNKKLNSYDDLNVLHVRIDIIDYFCFEISYASVKPHSNVLGAYISLFLTNYLLSECTISNPNVRFGYEPGDHREDR